MLSAEYTIYTVYKAVRAFLPSRAFLFFVLASPVLTTCFHKGFRLWLALLRGGGGVRSGQLFHVASESGVDENVFSFLFLSCFHAPPSVVVESGFVSCCLLVVVGGCDDGRLWWVAVGGGVSAAAAASAV